MKRLTVTLFILFSLTRIQAQEGEDVGWIARFGAAGGFTPAFIVPNLSPVNSLVRTMGIPEFSNSGMMTWGGGGYAYIMLIENLRIGGMGLSGSSTTSGSALGFDKEVTYSYGLGGLTVEYTLPFINRIAVSVGAIIGEGSAKIEIYQNQNNYNWNNISSSVTDKNISRTYINSFFTVTPTLNVDIPVNRFVALRIGGGYVYSLNNNWVVDNNKTLNGVPGDLKSNSFFIQTGVFFGLFAF